MKSVSFLLQGKGGVGKTLTASMIAQYLKEKGEPVVCIDADPVNASFAAIPALGATEVDLLSGVHINVDAVDSMVSRIVSEDSNFVIDGGAASFVPLADYLLRDGLLDLISEHKRVFIHTVIVGGPAFIHTTVAVNDLVEQFPSTASIVVWVNPFFGPVSRNGGGIEDEEFFTKNRHRIAAVVNYPALDQHFSGACFSRMLDENLTFAEAAGSEGFNLIARMRLANVWHPLRDQIGQVL